MKEKDLERNLDTIIIDGLIKEAEQDNADFAAAMRNMSNEDFEEMVLQPVYAEEDDGIFDAVQAESSDCLRKLSITEDIIGQLPAEMDAEVPKKSKSVTLRPWIAAAIAAAAVILIVLIPSINSMNAKLCDSALYMSEAYISAPKGGFDISSATTEQIKEELPNLERQYQSTIDKDGKQAYYLVGFQDAGWTLAVAYLKLHKKNDAIKVLKTLESQTQGTPFGNHCKELLKQLD